jgi:putative transposase
LVTVGAPCYKGFRFPAEIISHCVWLYHRFPLSLREVQEMMLQRGIIVSHETIRQWCATFGQTYAKRPAPAPSSPGRLIHKPPSRALENLARIVGRVRVSVHGATVSTE